MKILKNILIGFGVLFILFIVLIMFLSSSSSDFKDEHEALVIQVMSDLSKDWEIEDVHEKLTTEFISQVNTPQGKQVLFSFRRLGSVKAINDVDISHFSSGTSGKTGVFTFKATFEKGVALVKMTVVEKEGEVKVQHLYITPLGNSDNILPEPETKT